MRTPTNTRNYDSTLRELAERGHEVHVAFERMKKRTHGQTLQIDAICAEYPGRITQGMAPVPPKSDAWYSLAQSLRYGMDYLRYLQPAYADAHKLRERAGERAPSDLRRLTALPVLRTQRAVALMMAALRLVERIIPQHPRYEEYVCEARPDAVLVTPLVHVGPQSQVELLRAARRLGIPTALLVHSWDNLTNKGLVHERPDLVAVWNEDQAREATDMHLIPREHVTVTGAPTYDQWFEWAPSRSRAEFCRDIGLDPDRPFLLYLCSSYFIAPGEPDHVARWLDALHSSAGPLSDASVLIRPHPVAGEPWRAFDESRWPNVVVHPRLGADPVNRDTKQDYHASIAYSAGVVGVNTSAMIESAILGRAVHTLRVPEYRDTQEGTLHFRYLLRENGGPIVVSETMEAHLQDLEGALHSGETPDIACANFVGRFIRPLGISRRATAALADAIECLADADPRQPSSVARITEPIRAWAANRLTRMLDRRYRRTAGR